MQGAEKQKQIVEIKVVTWAKDSHGLFDYESKTIDVKRCKIEKSCKIYRKSESDVDIVPYKQQNDEEKEQSYMTSILTKEDIIQQNFQCNDNKTIQSSQSNPFYLNPQSNIPIQQQQQQQPENTSSNINNTSDNFLIVRSLKNQEGQQIGYKLQPGDIIKLGRIEYLVNEISDGKTVQYDTMPRQDNSVYQYTQEQLNQSRLETEDVKVCRICLLEDNTEDNPLISPCECKGSCKYVHFQCLKIWIESKIKKKQLGTTVTYNWKKSDCELCFHSLPKVFKTEKDEFDLIGIEKPNCPYMLIESMAKDKDNSVKDKKLNKTFFVISQPVTDPNQQEKVCLGRGHQCDVRISDISVSRQHAFIKFQDNQFVITDNNSKFGTLIKMRKAIPITKDKVAIQVGRTVITFILKNEQKAVDNNRYFNPKQTKTPQNNNNTLKQ